MKELVHQFQKGPITARIFAPKGQSIILDYQFEFVKTESDGTESVAFEWLELNSLAEAAQLTRKWIRDQVDSGHI